MLLRWGRGDVDCGDKSTGHGREGKWNTVACHEKEEEDEGRTGVD